MKKIGLLKASYYPYLLQGILSFSIVLMLGLIPGFAMGQELNEDLFQLQEEVNSLRQEVQELKQQLEEQNNPDNTLDQDMQAQIEAALSVDQQEMEEAQRNTTPPDATAEEETQGMLGRFFQSMNPELSFIADVALAWFSADDPLQTGGHDPTDNGFNLQQLEMAISSTVDPYFKLNGNLVFSLFGVEIEEIYATSIALPWNLQIRIGQFLTRFGRINNTHPHTWDFVDQMFIIGKFFGGEGNRGLGLELSVLLPLPWYVEIIGSATNPYGEATNRSFYGGSDIKLQSPLEFLYVLSIKQFFPLSDNWSFFWGLSGAFGPNPTGRGINRVISNRTEIYGTDFYFKYKPITFASYTIVTIQAELMMRLRQLPEDRLLDYGGYIYVFWRFAKRWGTAIRYEIGSFTWDYDTNKAIDPLDPYWTDYRHRISINGTFWPTEFSRIRLQFNTDILTWEKEFNRKFHWAGFLAFEFSVGAHGAHSF